MDIIVGTTDTDVTPRGAGEWVTIVELRYFPTRIGQNRRWQARAKLYDEWVLPVIWPEDARRLADAGYPVILKDTPDAYDWTTLDAPIDVLLKADGADVRIDEIKPLPASENAGAWLDNNLSANDAYKLLRGRGVFGTAQHGVRDMPAVLVDDKPVGYIAPHLQAKTLVMLEESARCEKLYADRTKPYCAYADMWRLDEGRYRRPTDAPIFHVPGRGKVHWVLLPDAVYRINKDETGRVIYVVRFTDEPTTEPF